MKFLKPAILAFLCFGFFFYGMASLEYKLFPYYQIMQVKIFLTKSQNKFQKTEAMNTFFQRLLVKKVYLNEDLFRGGGIANAGSYLFLLTNKGKTVVFDLENYRRLENSIQNIPMNFEAIMQYESLRDDFRPEWFRVSGIYAEQIDQDTFRVFATHHSYKNNSDCVQHNISLTDLVISGLVATTKTPWKTIFTAKPCISLNPDQFSNRQPYVGQLGGGKIIEHNDSTLLVTVGDYDRNGLNHTEAFSQNPDVPYGKTILVDKNSGSWSIYTSGHRNILGIYKNNDGTIWAAENGPSGGDEVNIIERGANYGWPIVSYGVWYIEEYKIGEGKLRGKHTNFKKPVYSWIPSIAPNNLVQIEGAKFPQWKGDLIIGTMRDQSLLRVRLNENLEAIYSERIPLGHRVRDLIALKDESLALITDDGFLIFLEDGGTAFEEMDAATRKRITVMNRYDGFNGADVSETAHKERTVTASVIFNRNCGSCHLMDNQNSIGPHLNNLFERKTGSLEDFNYSTVLMQDSREWSPSLLRSFLMEPQNEFPNNNMQQVNLSLAEADSIITYLQNYSGQ